MELPAGLAEAVAGPRLLTGIPGIGETEWTQTPHAGESYGPEAAKLRKRRGKTAGQQDRDRSALGLSCVTLRTGRRMQSRRSRWNAEP